MPSKAPPKNRPKSVPSTSRELVPVGPREVFRSKHHGRERDENGNKPLTARALVLRHGKHGAMGTGEVVLATRMSGREKLDLLAEDLIKQAVAAPFKLDVCLRIADSQLGAYLDELSALQEPDFFYQKMKDEVDSHTNPTRAKVLINKREHVVPMVASHIHNTYMMASGWRLVGDLLRELIEDGLDDTVIKSQLRAEPSMRSRFLVLYDTVNILVQAGQNNFAVLASATRHYGQYFNITKDPKTKQDEYIFDWGALKSVHKSFLDSLIVELCLPNSPIPPQVLYQLLGEAMEESPKDAKQFSQAVWDAVGDLSTIVEVQAMLEGILLGPEGEKWKQEPRKMPDAYEAWVDAQIFSAQATALWDVYSDLIFPLDKTRKRSVVDEFWTYIRKTYQNVCGKTPDQVWHVDDIKKVKPMWHGWDPKYRRRNGEDDLALVPSGKGGGKGGKKKRLAITNGDESDDSMPSLQTVSDSSEEEDEEPDDDDDYEVDDDDSDGSDEYDTDEEDELRDWLREAMDTAVASSDFYGHGPAPEFDALAEERKGNPFLKLLGSLRGRMFSASPTLKTATRDQPRKPYTGPRIPVSKTHPGAAPSKPAAPSTKPSTGPSTQRPHQTTVEEVEDEEAPSAAAKKKKKKPKKKKKAAAATADGEVPSSPPMAPAPAPAPQPASAQPAAATPPVTPKKAPAAAKTKSPPPQPRAASLGGSTTSLPFGASTTSLQTEQTAQSAHKYLQSEGLAGGKQKVKTRGAVGNLGNLDGIPEKGKKNRFWSAFAKKDKGQDVKNIEESDDEEEDEATKKEKKQGIFAGLSRRTSELMHQLLRTSEDKKQGLADMRWEKFVKLMEDMGFTYVPSTAGSRVRFDPPNPRDRSIGFHKPHPDPTIHPMKLKDFAKKLKEYYGWNEEEFLKSTQRGD